MLILLPLSLFLSLFVAAVAPPAVPAALPSTTQPSPAYEQGLAALRTLHEENLGLRAQLAAAQQDELPTVSVASGQVAHVRVDEFEPFGDEAHLKDYRWTFGDDDGAYNELGGFNAAHLYDRPGTFTIALNDRPVRRVVVAADARPVRLVRDDLELAAAARSGGVIIRLPPGSVAVRQTIPLAPGTLLLGDPAGTTLLWDGPPSGVMLDAPAGGVTVRGVTFDSAVTDGFEKTACTALRPGGGDVAMIGCTFLNVTDGINGNRRPKRVLMQDCRAPLDTGLRAYLAWVEGEQWVFLGNAAANSTREHIVRCGASGPGAPGSRFVLLAYNDFANLDRRAAAERPDKTDIAKSCLIFQVGEYGWAEHNLFRGISGIGPLAGADGLREPNRRFRHGVFRDNRHLDTLHVDDGAEHVLIADSRLELPPSGGDGFAALQIEGFDAQFGRGVVDVTVRDSVWISPYKNACQFWVQGPVEQRLALTNNTFVAGAGSYKWPTMPIVIEGGWQAGAYISAENALPPAPGGWPNKLAFARLGAQNDVSGYMTLPQWNALPGVSLDRTAELPGAAQE